VGSLVDRKAKLRRDRYLTLIYCLLSRPGSEKSAGSTLRTPKFLFFV